MNALGLSGQPSDWIGWRQQLELHPGLADIETWSAPVFDEDQAEQKAIYLRRRRAVSAVMLGSPVKAEAKQLGCHSRELYRLLERALGSPAGEQPALTSGVLPHARLVDYSGGVFLNLEKKYPEVFKKLRRHIKDRLDNKPTAPHYDIRGLWGELVRLLLEAGAKEDEYPFNQERPPLESLRIWCRNAENRVEADRAPNRAFEYAMSSHVRPDVMDVWDVDAHLQDFETCLDLVFPTFGRRVRIRRIWIYLAVDEGSTCCVGRAWSLSEQPRKEALLGCIENAMSVWSPHEDLPPGLAYPPGAGMPSMIPEYRYAIPYLIELDNAMVNYANQFRHYVHDNLNSAICWGRPNLIIQRRFVEMFNRKLAEYEHQMASTTGDSPTDPRRDSRRDRVPLVPYDHLEKIIDVCIATINATPIPSLFNQSPLDVLRQRIEDGAIIRQLPESARVEGRPFMCRRPARITGDIVHGQDVHVYCMYGSYKGTVLVDQVARGCRRIHLEWDSRDIRRLYVIDKAGNRLGEIVVESIWKEFAHDERFRKLIMKKADAGKCSLRNALTQYFAELAKNIDRPSKALEYLDVSQRIGVDLQSPKPDIVPANRKKPDRLISAPRPARWSPVIPPRRKQYGE